MILANMTLDEIKNAEFDILLKFDDFCNKNHLTYSLTFGTLLGAVRHNGFIPWDDDVDVMMPRKDYNKLFDMLYSNKKIADYIRPLSNKDKGYYYAFNKLHNINTIAKMENNLTRHGVWIDVFPVDNVPDWRLKSKVFHFLAWFMRCMIIAATTDFSSSDNKKLFKKKILCVFCRVIGIQRVSNYLDGFIQKYNKKRCKKVSIMQEAPTNKYDFSYSTYFPTEKHLFRGELFSISTGWDSILKGMYGDYMVIPKTEERQIHYVKARYKKTIMNDHNKNVI